jgi:hypothetical protein
MATKEDIFEKLVEEFLLHKGYFVRHNVRFLPRKDRSDFISNQDSSHSNIDLLGFNPKAQSPNRVWAVSCKTWQGGFCPEAELRNIVEKKMVRGREAWRPYRQFTSPKWSEAFIQAIENVTGERQFTYILAVTKVVGSKTVWETNPDFLKAMNGNAIRIIEFSDMLRDIYLSLKATLAGTEVLQLFKAVGIKVAPDAALAS